MTGHCWHWQVLMHIVYQRHTSNSCYFFGCALLAQTNHPISARIGSTDCQSETASSEWHRVPLQRIQEFPTWNFSKINHLRVRSFISIILLVTTALGPYKFLRLLGSSSSLYSGSDVLYSASSPAWQSRNDRNKADWLFRTNMDIRPNLPHTFLEKKPGRDKANLSIAWLQS